MTQQKLLTGARRIMIRQETDITRTDLKAAAVALGRNSVAVSKASTMRLALWVTKKTSAI